jgi:hypothetical protein
MRLTVVTDRVVVSMQGALSPAVRVHQRQARLEGSVDEGRVGLLPLGPAGRSSRPNAELVEGRVLGAARRSIIPVWPSFANLAAVSRQLWWRYPFALSVVTAL